MMDQLRDCVLCFVVTVGAPLLLWLVLRLIRRLWWPVFKLLLWIAGGFLVYRIVTHPVALLICAVIYLCVLVSDLKSSVDIKLRGL